VDAVAENVKNSSPFGDHPDWTYDEADSTIWVDYVAGGDGPGNDVFKITLNKVGDWPYGWREGEVRNDPEGRVPPTTIDEINSQFPTNITGPEIMKGPVVTSTSVKHDIIELDGANATTGQEVEFVEDPDPELEEPGKVDLYSTVTGKLAFYLFRGNKYKIHVNSDNKGFALQKTPSLTRNSGDQYTDGMSTSDPTHPASVVDHGTIVWTIPEDAPGQIFYRSYGFTPISNSHQVTNDGRKVRPYYTIFLHGYAATWIRGDYAHNDFNSQNVSLNEDKFLENYSKKEGEVYPQLERGKKYTIHIVPDAPFPFPSANINLQDNSGGHGAGSPYGAGMSFFGTTLHWTIPMDAPSKLWFRVAGESLGGIADPDNYRYITIKNPDLTYQENNLTEWWGDVISEHYFTITDKPKSGINYDIDYDDIKVNHIYDSGEAMAHQHVAVFKKTTRAMTCKQSLVGENGQTGNEPAHNLTASEVYFPQVFPKGSHIVVDEAIRTGSWVSLKAEEGSVIYSRIPYNNIHYSGYILEKIAYQHKEEVDGEPEEGVGFPNQNPNATITSTINQTEPFGEYGPQWDGINDTVTLEYSYLGTSDSLKPASAGDSSDSNELLPWQPMMTDSGDGDWPSVVSVVNIDDEAVYEEVDGEPIVSTSIVETSSSTEPEPGQINFDITRTEDRFWALRFNVKSSSYSQHRIQPGMSNYRRDTEIDESSKPENVGQPFAWHDSNKSWLNSKNIDLNTTSAYYNVPIYLKMTNPLFESFDGSVGAEGSTIDFKSGDASDISSSRYYTTYGFFKNHEDTNIDRLDEWKLNDSRAFAELGVYEPALTTLCTKSLRYGAPFWIFFNDSWNSTAPPGSPFAVDSPKTRLKQWAALYRWPVFDKAGSDYGFAPYKVGFTRTRSNIDSDAETYDRGFIGYRWVLSLGGNTYHHNIMAATQIDTEPKLPPNKRGIVIASQQDLATGDLDAIGTYLNSSEWDSYYKVGFWPWDSEAVWDLLPALPCPYEIGNDPYNRYVRNKVVGVSSPSIYLNSKQTRIDSGVSRPERYTKGLVDSTYLGSLESTSGEVCTVEAINEASNSTLPPTKITLTADELTKFKLIAMNYEFGGGHNLAKWTWDVNIKAHWVANDGTSETPHPGDIDAINDTVSDLRSLTNLNINVLTGGIVDECATDGVLPGTDADPDVHIGYSTGCADIPSNVNINIFFTTANRYALINPSAAGWVATSTAFVTIWPDSSYNIYRASVWIKRGYQTQPRRNHLIREEITQALGLLNDSDTLGLDSIFAQSWGGVATTYSAIDEKIISTLYSPELTVGMNLEDLDSYFA
jgi:hypothetical protein